MSKLYFVTGKRPESPYKKELKEFARAFRIGIYDSEVQRQLIEAFDEGVAARDAQMKEVDLERIKRLLAARLIKHHTAMEVKLILDDFDEAIQDFIKQEGQ